MIDVIKLLANKILHRILHPHIGGMKLLKASRRRFYPSYWYNHLEKTIEYRAHWISPQDIRFVSSREFLYRDIGKTLGGDWDNFNSTFEQLDFYQSFVAVNHNNSTWTETPFFKRVISEIELGKVKWGCQTENEFHNRIRSLENLYHEIRELGYIANHNCDEVSVNIGRHGDLLFNDGRHRLTFAKLLNVPRIPITIVVRHRQWVNFKREILEYAIQKYNGKVYAPLSHPDLEWIPSYHSHKRFELIRRNLINKNGSILDIGCHWGYFCHRFEEIGFECTGVEISQKDFYFLEKLRRASNKKFRIINQSIFDFVEQETCRYDIVLALAIFHHFIKTEEGFQKLKRLLSLLKMHEMYFLPHKPSEPQMQNAYWNPSEEDYVTFISQHSRLTKAVRIGYVEDGRSLYRLS